MKDLKELLTISDKISKNSVVYYSQQNVLRIIEEFSENIAKDLDLDDSAYGDSVRRFVALQINKVKQHLK